MKITILTLFPDMFKGFLSESIIGRAVKENKIEIDIVNLRDWGIGPHKSVDDTPYGGGAGMVLRVDVVAKAIRDVISNDSGREIKNSKLKIRNSKVILMTPQGQKFDQGLAKNLAEDLIKNDSHLILVCGHYEGFDERIRDYVDLEVSIGDYVLTGGELAAAVVTDAVVRIMPGVLGKEASHQNESFENGLLEHPHYTRPESFEDKKVPEVLLSGHHKKIEEWRAAKSEEGTKKKRPDLKSS